MSSPLTNATTIEEEAIEKFIELALSINKNFDHISARNILFKKELNNSRDIHKFVISLSKLLTYIKPERKYNLVKLNILGDNPLIPWRGEIEKGVKDLKLDSNYELQLTSLVLNSINHN